MTILFLEDDKDLGQSLLEELEEYDYEITWVRDGDDAAEKAYDHHFDLYLFDVNVPGIDGFSLLESLRDSGDTTPAIFVTSKNEIKDIKKGFDLGADDYIKKPFDIDELLVRIDAKLPKTSLLKLGTKFGLDPQNITLVCDTQEITLPKKEFNLLYYLATHHDQLIESMDLIDAMEQDDPITMATLRVYIKNIKRHITGCGIIENVRGVGYRFKAL